MTRASMSTTRSERLQALLRCPAGCKRPMRYASVVPCRGAHRVCEACAVAAGKRCPVCKQRYRKPRVPCRLTAAVAAVVFPDEEVPDLEPAALEAYRVATLVDLMDGVAHRTGRSDYMLELRRTAAASSADSLQRCNCQFPDLPGGFVMTPRLTVGANPRRYLGCPCYVNRATPGCGTFRWI